MVTDQRVRHGKHRPVLAVAVDMVRDDEMRLEVDVVRLAEGAVDRTGVEHAGRVHDVHLVRRHVGGEFLLAARPGAAAQDLDRPRLVHEVTEPRGREVPAAKMPATCRTRIFCGALAARARGAARSAVDRARLVVRALVVRDARAAARVGVVRFADMVRNVRLTEQSRDNGEPRAHGHLPGLAGELRQIQHRGELTLGGRPLTRRGWGRV